MAEDQTILHWTTALLWTTVLQMGALDLSDNISTDHTRSDIRDLQQLPIFQ